MGSYYLEKVPRLCLFGIQKLMPEEPLRGSERTTWRPF